jgi:hypothetical protein
VQLAVRSFKGQLLCRGNRLLFDFKIWSHVWCRVAQFRQQPQSTSDPDTPILADAGEDHR